MNTFTADHSFHDELLVGKLSNFKNTIGVHIVDELVNLGFFDEVPVAYTEKLKEFISVFELRVDCAVRYLISWENLLKVPMKDLRVYLDPKFDNNVESKSDGAQMKNHSMSMKQKMILMYHCLYVIVFWRNPGSYYRYKEFIVSMQGFRKAYESDNCFPKDRFHADNWESLFGFRNVVLLSAAIKPSLHNKGLFMKIGSILAEGRIYIAGGRSSFAAERRALIAEKEGILYVNYCSNRKLESLPPTASDLNVVGSKSVTSEDDDSMIDCKSNSFSSRMLKKSKLS